MNAALESGSDMAWADWGAAPAAQHLRGALQRGLPGFDSGAFTIDALRMSKVRRSSSLRRNPNPITLCLELDVRDSASGARCVQRYYAKAFRDGASAAAFDASDRGMLVAPAIGAALAHVEALDMLLWAWPNDPTLPQLATLLDPMRLPENLPDAVRALGCANAPVEVLRYAPERRATLRCTLCGAGAVPAQSVVYAKTFRDDQAAHALLQRFDHFWQLAQRDSAAPQVAQPLGWDRTTRTFWQAAAPGLPLMDSARTADAIDDFARIGGALAKLHLAALPAREVRSTGHWLAELRRRVQKIGRAAPDVAARALALAQSLEAATLRMPRARQTLIHGDFHPEQIWLNGERIVFFDFDEFALGNPMEDLAEFSVKLEQLCASPQRAERQVQALIAGYRAAAPRCFSAPWLQWHRALQTLVQASRAFIYQETGWRDLVAARLAACERIAATLQFEEAA